MSEMIPNGWVGTSIESVIKKTGIFIDGDWIESKDQDPNGNIRLLQLADIGDGAFIDKSNRFVNEEAFRRLNCTSVLPGDLLVARMPHPLGRACIVPAITYKAITAVDVCIIRPNKVFTNATWLMYFINATQFRNKIEELSSGTTRKRISRKNFGSIPLPLPPFNEQKRIVAKLDAIIPRIDSVKARLDKIPVIIKRFRQSVLTAAITGKLTEKWRDEHPDVESAEVLLGKIKNYRIKNATNDRELKAIKKNYLDGDIRLKEKEISCELPDSWKFCEINNIGNVYNGSTPSRKINKYWGGNIHWVSSGEVANTRINETREKITKSGFDNSSVKLLPQGTVLIAMIGEGKTRGQAAILDIESTCNQNVAAVVINHGFLLPEYLYNWFFMQYERNRGFGSGSGPKALNCQRVRELDFVLPPLEEQREIVRQVDRLFALADKLEVHYHKAKARIDKLSQSILAKAFRGELVSQDPNDEPAEKLLERIMAEKTKMIGGGQQKAKSRTRRTKV